MMWRQHWQTADLQVFAYHGATDEEYMRHIEMCLEHKPNIIIDDGGDLVEMIHNKRPDLRKKSVLGGCEETDDRRHSASRRWRKTAF